jgi:cell wall-associated NlpC family hydrolase
MRRPKAIATILSLAALVAPSGALAAATGGTAPHSPGTRSSGNGGAPYDPQAPVLAPAPAPAPVPAVPAPAQLVAGKAHAPASAPLAVVRALRAGNRLQTKSYVFGGGHRSFKDWAYDCSGTVSYALHGGGLLAAPLDSISLMSWGEPGAGTWITVYANHGHAFMLIAGLRLDTSGTGGRGPRWLTAPRSTSGFEARHPAGL